MALQPAAGPVTPRALAAAALAFAAVGGLSAADGGYFATAWGWALVGFSVAVVATALLRERIALGPLRLASLAGVAGVALWTAASAGWATVGAAHPVHETERVGVYVVAIAAFLGAAPAAEAAWLLAGALAALTAVSGYALGTRLLPDALGTFDSSGSYQLAEPFGYWNALGIAAVLGLLLAAGLGAHAERAAARAAAGACAGVLAPTLAFTFSRGSWGALGVGVVALLALDPQRVRLAVTLAALAPPLAVSVWLCTLPAALTNAGATRGAAAHAGHRLAPVLALSALACAAAAAFARARADRLAASPRAGRAVTRGLAAAGILLVLAAAAAMPKAVEHFRAPLPDTGGDLNRRLFSSSSNGRADYWRVARDEAEAHPLLGGGAGSWESNWVRERPTAFPARNAHDLYLETLAELGPLGLALLVAALAPPLLALRRARRSPLGAAAGAAYVAFLAHAAVDWDWQLTALGVAALAAGTALLAWGDLDRIVLGARVRTGVLAAGLAVAAAGVAIQIGNSAVARSQSAADRLDAPEAERQARRAIRWQPWSHEGWQRLAEAQIAAGDVDSARRSLVTAIGRDRSNWELWLALAGVADGSEARAAFTRARALNPRAPELREFPG